jgi:hypothetical protein
MGVIYRPPGQNLDLFNTEIENLLSAVSRRNKEVVLVGDFNIDLLKIDDHKASNTFYNCLMSHHFLPAITRPTSVTPHSSTLIDNLFTNTWLNITDSTIVTSDISDHLPILVRFNFMSSKLRPTTPYVSRLITEERIDNFGESLSRLNWSSVSDACFNGETNKAYDLFLTQYKNTYEKAFPKICTKRKNGSSFNQPWMTKGLLKSSRKKEQLYLKYVKNPTLSNKNKFTVYRNKF